LADISTVKIFNAINKEYTDVNPITKSDTTITFTIPNLYSGGQYVLTYTDDFGYSSITTTIIVNTTFTTLTPASCPAMGCIFTLSGSFLPLSLNVTLEGNPLEILDSDNSFVTFRALNLI
jgi:hypothetical protein